MTRLDILPKVSKSAAESLRLIASWLNKCPSTLQFFHGSCKILTFAQLQLMTQRARTSASPEVLPAKNPFAFPEWGRLRNNSKRRRRRRPEGVAQSTWFTPHPVPQLAPRAIAMAIYFRRQDPVPGSGTRTNCAQPPSLDVLALLALLAWLAHAVVASLLSPPTMELPSSLTFSSFFLLLTHFLTHPP
ncbi:hypothetical protein VTK56DRAFT_2710 [Thermocarpiscus australiensis]